MSNTIKHDKAALAAIISTAEAAQLMKLTPARVKVFCAEGRLVAKRIGRDWAIVRRSAIALAKQKRPASLHRSAAEKK